MSGRYGIGRLVESKDFANLQNKLENLYDTYNVIFLKKFSYILNLFIDFVF